MKNDLNNIDELFKKSFDGFEANVDPSVWSNIQSSIGSSAASSTAAGIAGKSIALKIVAGVIALGTVATGTYFVSENMNDKETSIAVNTPLEVEELERERNIVLEDQTKEIIEEQAVEIALVEEGIENNSKSVTESTKIEPLKASENINEEQVVGVTNEEASTINVSESSAETTKSENVKQEESIPVEKEDEIKLLVNINVDNVSGKAPLTVQFDAMGEGAESYFWDFRDGSEKVNGDSPLHIFEEEGTYRVVLSGIDKYGNTKDSYKTIIVEKDYSSSLQKLANVFSPNGDGVNDFIKIRGKNIEKVQVQILDSKGGLVYFLNSLEDVWDGKDQSGNRLVQGQYYMIGSAIGNDGKKHNIKQAVNLRE